MADKKSTLLYLEKNSAELFRFTRQLIAAPSPNPPGEEVAVADLVVKRMKDLGLADPVIEASEIDAEHPLVEAMQQAAESVLGQPIPLGCMPGTTDAPKLQFGLGIPTIPAFGPGFLPLAHGPNEYISIKSPLQAAKIYALGVLAYLSDTDSNQGELR